MADKENIENTSKKDQKEEENERIKTENKQNETQNQETEDQNNINPSEVIKEVEQNSDEIPTEKDTTNNSTENGTSEDKKEVSKQESAAEKKDAPEAPPEKQPKTVRVDLKALQTHYRTHTKTTLPHLLTEYGFEDTSQPNNYKTIKMKKKKKKVEIVDTSDDEDRHHKNVKDEKFRAMFGEIRNVDKYYEEYLDFIQAKVNKERQQAQQKKEEDERLARKQQEEELNEEWEKKTKTVEKAQSVASLEEHKKNHTVTRRLQRMELKHDDSFLKEIPKTDLARIVKLQDKMKREGKLKTQGDVDKFWADIRDPDVFYAQFKVKRTFDPGPAASKSPVGFLQPELQPRSLSHISESSKGEKESWAITQKYQSLHGQKTPTGERSRKNSTQLAKEAALDLERRCPKLEMPPMACFSLKLGESPPDPAEVQKKIELKAREKSRKKFQRKLQKMYQMAMTNSAASNRILAQHGDLTAIMEGGTLRDVLAVFDEPQDLEQHFRYMTDPSRQEEQLSIVGSTPSQSLHGSRNSSAGSRVRLTPISQASSRSGSLSKRKKKSPEMIEAPPEPVPLSFNEILTREKTVEAKCLSTLWSNYMSAGKSEYIPT